MLESIQSLLDAFPEGVIQTGGGLVLSANRQARQYLPGLTPGEPLPFSLPLPNPGETGAGLFAAGGRTFSYSCKDLEGEQLLLFRPDASGVLEDWQLDGLLRQLRELLGELLAEVGPATVPGGELASASFNKTFHRLFRLVGNLEFLRQTAEEGGVPFHPILMDLDSVCDEVARLAGEPLEEGGVCLTYVNRNKKRGLMISGDPDLLKKLLLGLISNAAKAVSQGRVDLSLSRRGENAVITLSNRTSCPRFLESFSGPGPDLPLPGQGAGLGLSVARHIVRLHHGQLMPYESGAVQGVLVSLPISGLKGHTSLHTPIRQDGGLDLVLTELSDVLPVSLFGLEGLD